MMFSDGFLECAYCDESRRTFEALGRHVKTDHPEIVEVNRRLLSQIKKQRGSNPSATESISEKDSKTMAGKNGKKSFKQNPQLDSGLFARLENKKGEVVAELVSVFAWKNGDGLTFNFKDTTSGKEFSFLTNYSRFDIKSLFSQVEGTEFTFVTREGNNGKVFVNAKNPYSKE